MTTEHEDVTDVGISVPKTDSKKLNNVLVVLEKAKAKKAAMAEIELAQIGEGSDD